MALHAASCAYTNNIIMQVPCRIKKWASLACLVALQVTVGLVYKLSQKKSSSYSYSTFSALAIAESVKFGISAALHHRFRRPSADRIPVTKHDIVPNGASSNYWKILALALMYCINNQLTFSIFLTADPASINIFKSGSTIITAAISCMLLGRYVTWPQWAAILLQVTGLFVTQYDACKSQMVLPVATYTLLSVSVSITALSGVWNEHQLKTLPLSLHQQNMVLYAGGFVFNAAGHVLKSRLSTNVPGFFSGYDGASIAVVAVNACFGVVVTAVYKYADSIMKCLANAVTTVLLLGLSWLMFDLQLHATILAGCVTVVVAVGLYSTTPPTTELVASTEYRAGVALSCFLFFACFVVTKAFIQE